MGDLFYSISEFNVKGHYPFSFFNLFLGMVSGIALATGVYQFMYEDEIIGILAFAIGVVCFIILFFRNRELDNILLTLGISIATALLGIVLVAVFLVAVGVKSAFSFADDTSTNTGNTYSNSGMNNTNRNNSQDYSFSKQDDLNAQMQGYADAQQYQDLMGLDGHNIDPDDPYTRYK